METKYQKGMHGQAIAADFLQDKGYKILRQNYRIRTGEIDIIAREPINGYIVFIEVKFRRSISHGLPRESVTSTKQRQIIRTALHYVTINQLDNHDFRFDVVEVLDLGGEVTIEHIENAFDAQ